MATPFELLQKEIRTLRREIRRLKGDPNTENQEQVEALVGDGNNGDDRSGGRSVQGGFSAIAKQT